MIFNLTIAPLIVLIVVCEVTLCPTEDNERFANTLNTLLNFSGWKEIKMRAKCLEPAGDEMESYNGKDLVTKIGHLLDLNKIYKPDTDNRIVDEENVKTKYYMTLRLLGCVYTDVLQRCMAFSKYLIEFAHTVGPRGITVLEHVVTYQPLTEYMFTALDYVIAMDPAKDSQNSVLIDVAKMATQTKSKVENVFAGIRYQLESLKVMPNNGPNEDDKDHEERISESLKALLKSIDNLLNADERGHLAVFKSNHCVDPGEIPVDHIDKWYNTLQEKCEKRTEEEFAKFIHNQIKQFVGMMATIYYSGLGFVYVNGITTLSNTIAID